MKGIIETHLSLISIDNHEHTLHVYAIHSNTFQTLFEFFVQAIEMFCRDRANINWKIEACCSRAFFEINI